MRANLTRQILEAHRVAGPSFENGAAVARSVVADHVVVSGEASRLAGRAFDGLRIPRTRALVGLISLDESLRLRSPVSAGVGEEVEAWRRRGAHVCRPGEGLPDAVYLGTFAAPGRLAAASEGSVGSAGAFGTLVLPADCVELALALAGLPWEPPPCGVFEVRIEGMPLPGMGGTDIGLALARELPATGARGHVLEFRGAGVRGITMPDRIALARMGALLGARAVLFPSDEVTRAALAVAGRESDWRSLEVADDAGYDRRFEIDLDRLEPLVAPAGFPGAVRRVRHVAGYPVRRVWIGEHTTLSDLERFSVLTGAPPAGVTITLVPGSRALEEAARRHGVLDRLRAAGATVATIGTAPDPGGLGSDSAGLIHGVSPRHLEPGERGWSLAGIETCAASARAGRLTDPRELDRAGDGARMPEPCGEDLVWLRPLPATETGPAAPVRIGSPRLDGALRGTVLIAVGDYIGAARILPVGPRLRTHGYDPDALAAEVFGSIDPRFAARARECGGGFVVAGIGFGAGEPGEEAALSLAALGVRATLALAYDPAFHRRLVHAGILPLRLLNRALPESLGPGDELEIPGLPEGLEVGKPVVVRHLTRGFQWALGHALDERDLRVVRAGGSIGDGLASAPHLEEASV